MVQKYCVSVLLLPKYLIFHVFFSLSFSPFFFLIRLLPVATLAGSGKGRKYLYSCLLLTFSKLSTVFLAVLLRVLYHLLHHSPVIKSLSSLVRLLHRFISCILFMFSLFIISFCIVMVLAISNLVKEILNRDTYNKGKKKENWNIAMNQELFFFVLRNIILFLYMTYVR